MALKLIRLLIMMIVMVPDFIVQFAVGAKKPPNIVILMADDMGFDDVSFRGSNEFLTPNIDALAFNGVILNNYYVPAMCTPSRASLLTGKNPINIGMQHYVIPNDQPWGLPLTEKTMAQYFKEAGYFTSLIGKWHLGFSKKSYTPLYRGFDHHFGYYGGYVDYYDQTTYSTSSHYSRGHDFRNNLNVTRSNQGTYVTDSLTEEAERLIRNHNTEIPLLMIVSQLAPHSGNPDEPFQAPSDEIKKFHYIPNVNRSIYAAMVSKLDQSVGKVVQALDTKGILTNTILLFYSDNGAPTLGLHSNEGSNYPFRGQKNSPWEGGIRSSAAIWSPLIRNGGRIWNQTMHVSDWLPTLASAAGIQLSDDLHLDGLNLWTNLTKGEDPVLRQIVQNIDDIFQYVSYTRGKWKYINGTTQRGNYDGWLSDREKVHIDPRSHRYEEEVKNSITWKTLVQFMQTDEIDDTNIVELRQKASINCSHDKEISRCEPLLDECIFNLVEDPCEQNNLIGRMRNSRLLQKIRREVEEYRSKAVAPVGKPSDPRCDPKYYDNEWTWWEDIYSRS
ncbi:arylsulfatase B-like [Eupeodes corollae]|uniref:arylsulfatase B-like n=1 Tax=Eupeodes corollae TaxID=290404 RepID=UPI002492CF02|nr:arylsulfatase B-like [Eupeodes corollae]XP_055903368.1 arylsulfatase B-like [Eupeodes corollae]XP_055903369.1 arylsulfatase B-like [Eupeodes corollae]XP_055903370.1 arylsulfatase B-like [Eupeodes corollae]